MPLAMPQDVEDLAAGKNPLRDHRVSPTGANRLSNPVPEGQGGRPCTADDPDPTLAPLSFDARQGPAPDPSAVESSRDLVPDRNLDRLARPLIEQLGSRRSLDSAYRSSRRPRALQNLEALLLALRVAGDQEGA